MEASFRGRGRKGCLAPWSRATHPLPFPLSDWSAWGGPHPPARRAWGGRSAFRGRPQKGRGGRGGTGYGTWAASVRKPRLRVSLRSHLAKSQPLQVKTQTACSPVPPQPQPAGQVSLYLTTPLPTKCILCVTAPCAALHMPNVLAQGQKPGLDNLKNQICNTGEPQSCYL